MSVEDTEIAAAYHEVYPVVEYSIFGKALRAGRFKEVFGVSHRDPEAASKVEQKINNLRTLADSINTAGLSTRITADLVRAQQTATRFGFSTSESEDDK